MAPLPRAPIVPPAKPWPFENFGPSGKVVWRRDLKELGVTEVRFANGVRLNIKSTGFAKGQVLIGVRVGDGLLGAPAGKPAPAWLANLVVLGGTGEFSRTDVVRSLGPAQATERFRVGDDAFLLNGETRTGDLRRALQMMTATIAFPAFRAEGLAPLKSAAARAISDSSGSPQAVLDRDLPEILHGGDVRWRPLPTAPEIVRATPSDAEAFVHQALKSGALEVTIVGDVAVETAVDLTAATFGALAERPAPTPPAAKLAAIGPTGRVERPATLLHTGSADRAIGVTIWPATDLYADAAQSRALFVAAAILKARVKDRLNAQHLGVFAPGGGAFLSNALPGYGFVEVGVELPPWRLEDYRKSLGEAAAELSRSGPTLREVKETMSAITAAETQARGANAFWLGALSQAQSDPRSIAFLGSETAAMAPERAEAMVAQVASVSRIYLTAERAWSLEVRTADAPTPTTTPRASPDLLRQPDRWAQSYSDLAADPRVRFGVLSNGMRYALKHNANPPGETSIRFRIGAGSLEERDDQRGLAHLLEHMAFKGSLHAPAGDLVERLQRLGVSFGPDVNAFTQKSQTFYKLDLPRSDAEHLDAGLFLMREIGGELSIAPSALNAERGVVLAEERLDESPGLEAEKLKEAFYLDGQLAGRRNPMGSTEIIRRAPAGLVRAYYDAWYRPENATLILIGDFDVEAMEKRIASQFSDWRARGPAAQRPDLGTPKARGESVQIITRPGLLNGVSVAWLEPFDPRADTFARERADLVTQLGLDILNKRLSRLSLSAAAPFVQASAARIAPDGSALITQIAATPNPNGLGPSLASLVQEQRRLVQFGATGDEFEEALKARRDQVGSAVPGDATKPTAAVADQILRAVNDDRVVMSAVGAYAQFDAIARRVTLDEVNAALKHTFSGSGPLITLTTPVPFEGGEAGLRGLYDAAIAAPVSAGDAETIKPWPYSDFGSPGRIVARSLAPDLNVTEARFANGVRLNVRPTSFAKNQILVTVRMGEGLLGLPPNQPGRSWLLGALATGGTEDLTFDEIQRSLKGLGVTANFAFADDGLVATGMTGPRDLGRQLELLTALISRPGYRAEGVEHMRNLLAAALPSLSFTPEGVLSANLQPMLHGDLRWQGLPTPEALASAKPADLKALVDPTLRAGAMELTIVADVTPDRALYEVARTLGTLPNRAEPLAVPATTPRLRPPSGGGAPRVLYHKGRADQAIAFVEWPTHDFYADPHEAHVLWLAASILQNRLIDRIRTRESASYAPSADAVSTSEEIGFGYVYAQAEVAPARIDGFYRDIEEIVADMSRTPPSDDELLRARAPLIADEEKSRQTLGFWATFIDHAQSDPRQLASIRRKIPDFQSVTAAEIAVACRKFLRPDTAWKLIVRAEPQGKP